MRTWWAFLEEETVSHAWSSFATMVLRMKHLFAAAVTAAPLLTPAVASAVGLEVNGRLGYGSAGGDSPVRYEPAPGVSVSGAPTGPIWDGKASPYGGGLFGEGGLGLRTGKFVSVGLGVGYRSSSAESPDPAIRDLTRSAWFAGPYVRVYLPFVPIVDPYVGLGVQYVADTQRYKTMVGNVDAKYTLEHHGIGVPITLGVDYTIAKMFSIGPSFQYSLIFPAGACAKIGSDAPGYATNSFCASEAENKRVTAGKGYGVWSLGLSLRFTFPPT